MVFLGKAGEYLELLGASIEERVEMNNVLDGVLTILWCRDDFTKWKVDNKEYSFCENCIVFISNFHKVEVIQKGRVDLLRFNRAFYCILDHDDEVGCKGLLFYSSNQLPVMKISKQDEDLFQNLFSTFQIEMKSQDLLQLSMLQMLLKRLLIMCTRLYKDQYELDQMTKEQLDLVREFNFLVELHFKEKRRVACYATLMHKSPKTISNYFAKVGVKPPLQIIQDRIMIEARRYLVHTTKMISEIAYELGFEDVQSFSRFFKKNQGISPVFYRKKRLMSNR